MQGENRRKHSSNRSCLGQTARPRTCAGGGRGETGGKKAMQWIGGGGSAADFTFPRMRMRRLGQGPKVIHSAQGLGSGSGSFSLTGAHRRLGLAHCGPAAEGWCAAGAGAGAACRCGCGVGLHALAPAAIVSPFPCLPLPPDPASPRSSTHRHSCCSLRPLPASLSLVYRLASRFIPTSNASRRLSNKVKREDRSSASYRLTAPRDISPTSTPPLSTVWSATCW